MVLTPVLRRIRRRTKPVPRAKAAGRIAAAGRSPGRRMPCSPCRDAAISPAMTLRKIARLGHPVLLARAEPVADPADPAIQTPVDDMLATMVDADGIGLAAPQVHEACGSSWRIELRGPDRARRRGRARPGQPGAEPEGDETEDGLRGLPVDPGSARARAARRRVAYRGAGPRRRGRSRASPRAVRARAAARGGSPGRRALSDADARPAPARLRRASSPQLTAWLGTARRDAR